VNTSKASVARNRTVPHTSQASSARRARATLSLADGGKAAADATAEFIYKRSPLSLTTI
jgi:hypothetical protein